MTNECIAHETEEFQIIFEGDPDFIATFNYSDSLKGVKGAIWQAFKVANNRRPTLVVSPIRITDGHFKVIVSSSRLKDDTYGIHDILSSLGFFGNE